MQEYFAFANMLPYHAVSVYKENLSSNCSLFKITIKKKLLLCRLEYFPLDNHYLHPNEIRI